MQPVRHTHGTAVLLSKWMNIIYTDTRARGCTPTQPNGHTNTGRQYSDNPWQPVPEHITKTRLRSNAPFRKRGPENLQDAIHPLRLHREHANADAVETARKAVAKIFEDASARVRTQGGDPLIEVMLTTAKRACEV